VNTIVDSHDEMSFRPFTDWNDTMQVVKAAIKINEGRFIDAIKVVQSNKLSNEHDWLMFFMNTSQRTLCLASLMAASF